MSAENIKQLRTSLAMQSTCQVNLMLSLSP